MDTDLDADMDQRWTYEDRSRDLSYAAWSPRMPGATRNWKRQGALEEVWPCQYLGFGLLASRTFGE